MDLYAIRDVSHFSVLSGIFKIFRVLREQCVAAYPTRKVLLVVKWYAKSSIKIQKLIEILIIENFQKICIFSV